MNAKPRAYLLRTYQEAVNVLDGERRDRDIAIQDLAERTGVSRTQLYRWSTGDTQMLAPGLWRLAAALGYDIALIPRQEQP